MSTIIFKCKSRHGRRTPSVLTADFKPEENRSSLVYVCTHICPVYLVMDCHDCFFFSSTSGHRQGFVQLVHKGGEGTSITLFNVSIDISIYIYVVG